MFQSDELLIVMHVFFRSQGYTLVVLCVCL